MLQSALEHYQRQQQITAAAIEATKARENNPAALAAVIAALQLRAAQDALDSIEEMLEEQNLLAPLIGALFARAFAGTASTGLPLEGLFSLADGIDALMRMALTQIQDAARQAAATSIAARPRLGYVRMLNPPSCSRCVVLAGKFYKFNEGFERHPLCDCRHVPSVENVAGDLTTNPDTYFHSISASEQDRIFTIAGAEAIRNGADISQVVNARSGMSSVGSTQTAMRTVSGRQLTVNLSTRRQARGRDGFFTTTQGSTRRGTFGRSNAAGRARLMPESIIELAGDDRAEAQRLLRLYRYII